MTRLKWIESAGGPLILISDNVVKLWSGVFNRAAYSTDIIVDTDNFLDPNETDYGKACSIRNYIGVVDIKNNSALVLGDDPMMTTVFNSSDYKIGIARWYYAPENSDEIIDQLLLGLDLESIDNWEFELALNFSSKTQYLFDSAWDGKRLDNAKINDDFLVTHLLDGQYKVSTAIYEPNSETKLFLHKLVAIR
jgi:hypothetical protein